MNLFYIYMIVFNFSISTSQKKNSSNVVNKKNNNTSAVKTIVATDNPVFGKDTPWLIVNNNQQTESSTKTTSEQLLDIIEDQKKALHEAQKEITRVSEEYNLIVGKLDETNAILDEYKKNQIEVRNSQIEVDFLKGEIKKIEENFEERINEKEKNLTASEERIRLYMKEILSLKSQNEALKNTSKLKEEKIKSLEMNLKIYEERMELLLANIKKLESLLRLYNLYLNSARKILLLRIV